jgi:thymidylate synthase (FAD)
MATVAPAGLYDLYEEDLMVVYDPDFNTPRPRVFSPLPRPTITLPPAPARGPVVTPIDWSAGDRFIAQCFWASTEKDGDAWGCSDEAVTRVINFGMGAKPVVHGTPFGHGHLTVHVDRLPLAIAGQLIRHRVQHQSEDGLPLWAMDWLPNISQKSYRYVTAGGSKPQEANLDDVMHLPIGSELRTQDGRPGAYTYAPLPISAAGWMVRRIEDQCAAAWTLYLDLVEGGLAPEQARFILPQATLTRLYATASYRNWLSWLVQRNDSHAQGEVVQVAEQVEEIIRQCIPITYDLWLSHGRRPL